MMHKKESLSVIHAIKFSILYAIKATPGMVFAYACMAIVHGGVWGVVAPVNQFLYEAIEDIAFGDGLLRYVYIGAVFVTLLMILQQVMNAVHNFFSSSVMLEKMRGKLARVLQQKMSKLPAQMFEDKNYLDDIEKAWQGRNSVLDIYCTLSDGIFFYGTYFLVMGRYLWQMRPSLLLALIFIFLPTLLSQVVRAKLYAKLEKESSPIRRQNGHYENALIGLQTMRETRLFGAYYFFKKLYMDSLALLAKKEWTTNTKIAAISLGLNFVQAAGWVGIVMLLFNSLVNGYVSVGAFAAVFGSIGMMFSLVEEIIGRVSWTVTENLGKVHNFINVIEIPTPQLEYVEPDFSLGIVAKNITFSYSNLTFHSLNTSPENSPDAASFGLDFGQ